jgi:hypothetical protein
MSKSTGKRQPTEEPKESEEPRGRIRRLDPGRTIVARENKIISMAYDLVESRIAKGTATSQEVTHFLELGSSLARLKAEKLTNENLLLKAKADQIKEQKKVSELYSDALEAMKRYSGNGGSGR